MMVKCPECNADISSLASKCPNCGFPGAGFCSKQNAELLLSEIKKNQFVALFERDYIIQIPPNTSLSHSRLGVFHQRELEKIRSCSLVKDEYGYRVLIESFCPNCGIYHAYFVSS